MSPVSAQFAGRPDVDDPLAGDGDGTGIENVPLVVHRHDDAARQEQIAGLLSF
jgi:hypothetical protein